MGSVLYRGSVRGRGRGMSVGCPFPTLACAPTRRTRLERKKVKGVWRGDRLVVSQAVV